MRERFNFDSYHSGFLRTSHLGSSTVSHGRFMPTAQAHTHWTESENEKKKKTKQCYSSILQHQMHNLELNVQFSLDIYRKAVSGSLDSGSGFHLTNFVSKSPEMNSPESFFFDQRVLISNDKPISIFSIYTAKRNWRNTLKAYHIWMGRKSCWISLLIWSGQCERMPHHGNYNKQPAESGIRRHPEK